MKRRYLTLLPALALCLCLSGCYSSQPSSVNWPTTPPAEPKATSRPSQDSEDEGVIRRFGRLSKGQSFTLYDDGTLEITGGAIYTPLVQEPMLSDSLDSITSISFGNGVTSLCYRACAGLTRLRTVTIDPQAKMTLISEYAFEGCTTLTQVTFPRDGSLSIGECAFEGCTGLSNLTLTGAVKSIGFAAFRGCTGLRHLSFPEEGTMQLGSRAFSGCVLLEQVVLNSGVSKVGSYCFEGCTGLYDAWLGYSGNLGRNVFSGCTALTSLTIGMATVPSGAFSGMSNLRSVTLQDSVTGIGSYAFAGCTGLKELRLPDSLQQIDAYAFDGCTGLTSVDSGEGSALAVIGDYAFSGCLSLRHMRLGTALSQLGCGACSGCTLTLHYRGTQAQWETAAAGFNKAPDRHWDEEAAVTISYECTETWGTPAEQGE